MASKQFSNKLADYVESERLGREQSQQNNLDQQIQAYLQALETTKNSASGIYTEFRSLGSANPVTKIKNYLFGKIGNIVRNVVEKSTTTQQKYNNQLLELVKLQQQKITTLELQLAESKLLEQKDD